MSAAAFRALKQGQRQALAAAELSDEEAALIEAAEVPEAERYPGKDAD